MNIAIIGAGISGLTAAYRLSAEHQVTLFESQSHLGGHAHTVDVEIAGERHAIDVGFIVFNDRTYPHFSRLLAELDVASAPTSMGFSVRCDQQGLEYNGSSLNGLFSQRSNLLRPSFLRMLGDIARFNQTTPRQLAATAEEGDGLSDDLTVGEFLARGNYSRQFADHYLLPMGSAIWSCPPGTVRQFPLRFIVEFFANHGLLNWRDRPTWRFVVGGSRNYVTALSRRFRDRVRLQTPIVQVRRHSGHVDVAPRNRPAEFFDHVIFACHSDQALRMLADPSQTEREVLGAFPYERSLAVLHTDVSLLPRKRRAWASWNYSMSAGETRGTVTYCMNYLQNLTSRHVFNVTLNGEDKIDPAQVLGQFPVEHPVFTTGRARAQARHGELTNANRTSYCGAYWRNGFHEDGMVSALAVCQVLDATATKSAPPTVARVANSLEVEHA